MDPDGSRRWLRFDAVFHTIAQCAGCLSGAKYEGDQCISERALPRIICDDTTGDSVALSGIIRKGRVDVHLYRQPPTWTHRGWCDASQGHHRERVVLRLRNRQGPGFRDTRLGVEDESGDAYAESKEQSLRVKACSKTQQSKHHSDLMQVIDTIYLMGMDGLSRWYENRPFSDLCKQAEGIPIFHTGIQPPVHLQALDRNICRPTLS